MGATDGEFWQGNGYTGVTFNRDSRLALIELLPVGDLDAAMARFAELEQGLE